MLRRVCDELLDEPVASATEGNLDINLGRKRQFLANRHGAYPELGEFLLKGIGAQLATEVFGGPAYLFFEQFVVKGANQGASFAWHQDSAYVGFEHAPYLTVWIALDKATLDNGCIYVLPRDLDIQPEVDPHVWDEAGKELVGYQGDEAGQPLPCEAGSVVAFSSRTLHRSSANITPFPRRAYICQYSPEPLIDSRTGLAKQFAIPVSENAAAR